MKILIADIPDEGLSPVIEEKFRADELPVVSPVTGAVEITSFGREVTVEGRLNATLELECSRCLKKYPYRMDVPVHVIYHPADEIGADRHELKDEEMDMGFYQGEELDLRELVREQIVLNIPMQPLCDENCRGICPQCGIDLNTAICSCVREKIDPRLQVLKKLLEKRKE